MVHHHSPKAKRLLDVIVAPYVTKTSLSVLERREGKLRVMTNPALGELDKDSLDTEPRMRYVRGGFLQEDNYTYVLDGSDGDMKKNGRSVKRIDDARLDEALLGWGVASTSNSNTVSIVKGIKLIGNGVGQQDRVLAAQLAVKRAQDAGHDVADAHGHSDSFFPFADGLQILTDAGVRSVLASSGSVNDKQVITAAKEAGATLWMLPDAKMRGFFAH